MCLHVTVVATRNWKNKKICAYFVFDFWSRLLITETPNEYSLKGVLCYVISSENLIQVSFTIQQADSFSSLQILNGTKLYHHPFTVISHSE